MKSITHVLVISLFFFNIFELISCSAEKAEDDKSNTAQTGTAAIKTTPDGVKYIVDPSKKCPDVRIISREGIPHPRDKVVPPCRVWS